MGFVAFDYLLVVSLLEHSTRSLRVNGRGKGNKQRGITLERFRWEVEASFYMEPFLMVFEGR